MVSVITDFPGGLRDQGHELRLHVRCEARIFFGGHIAGAQWIGGADAQAGEAFALDFDAAGCEFFDHRGEMLRSAVRELHVATGNCRRDDECAGFDAIGNYSVSGAVQFRDALHVDGGSSSAFNLRTHFLQKIDQIGDFRLARGVGENRFALGEDCGGQNILRAGDGDLVKMNFRAAQALAAGFDVPMIHGRFSRPFFQGLGCAGPRGGIRWRTPREVKRARSRSGRPAGRE